MPLGWHISVYRQKNGGDTPSCFGDEPGDRLAVWQAGLQGLRWLHRLVESGCAVDLGGNGYPCKFSARAADVIPHLVGEPPDANPTWLIGEGDVVLPNWLGKTTKASEVINACSPTEWLLIQAWDES
jgi:hypothetical protein